MEYGLNFFGTKKRNGCIMEHGFSLNVCIIERLIKPNMAYLYWEMLTGAPGHWLRILKREII